MSSHCTPTTIPFADGYIAWLVENVRYDWLTPMMHGLSAMVEEPFLIALFSLLYWCWRKQPTSWLTLLAMLCVLTNMQLKEWFTQCRPLLDTQLQTPHDHSFPSGHSQLAIILWGWLAYHIRAPFFTIVSIFMILAIGFSRNYLGVHYAHDVLAGFAVGGAMLWVAIYAFTRSPELFNKPNAYYSIALLISLGLLPWVITLSNRNPGAFELYTVMVSVLFALQLDSRTLQFQPLKHSPKAYLAIMIGTAGLIAIQTIGTTMLTSIVVFNHRFNVAMIYFAIAIWIFYLAPLCFIKLRLCRT